MRKAGVIGWPVAHSLSPKLHGFWLQRYGIDGSYEALPVEPKDLELTLRNLQANGFRGVNLTLPHKEAAFRIVDRADDTATRTGAVNTIVVEQDGSLTGSNSDLFGFAENIRAGLDGAAMPQSALVIGAGGAARAVIAALHDTGTRNITLVNRSLHKAEAIMNDMKTHGIDIACVAWDKRESVLENTGLLVNTTSLGMRGQPELALKLDGLPANAIVTDIVYTPLETGLLKQARERGLKTVDGLGMLLHQARPGFAAWFGQEPKVTDDLREYLIAQGAGA